MSDLRYPIGKFQLKDNLDEAQRREFIQQIAEAPARLHDAVKGLSVAQLDTPYRPGGWTVRQVVHHVPDSHLNAYTRFKLAMTEQEPTIKTYDEKQWSELKDARTAPITMSLSLLEALHQRWVLFLQSLTPADFRRKFNHPEHGLMTVDMLLGMYAWHGRHHVAHITSLRECMAWK